jgi:hypothetical protein
MQDKIVHSILKNTYDHQENVTRTRTAATKSPASVSSVNSTLQPPIIGYFHIRRGDAIGDCDTSLERLQQYLRCSFDSWYSFLQSSSSSSLSSIQHAKRQRDLILLFSSDERDAQYRKSVAQLVYQQQQQQHASSSSSSSHNNTLPRVSFVDLDELTNSMLQEEIRQGHAPVWRLNNFYLYQIMYQLSYNTSVVKVWLEQRRGFGCPACTNMTEQLFQNQVY